MSSSPPEVCYRNPHRESLHLHLKFLSSSEARLCHHRFVFAIAVVVSRSSSSSPEIRLRHLRSLSRLQKLVFFTRGQSPEIRPRHLKSQKGVPWSFVTVFRHHRSHRLWDLATSSLETASPKTSSLHHRRSRHRSFVTGNFFPSTSSGCFSYFGSETRLVFFCRNSPSSAGTRLLLQ